MTIKNRIQKPKRSFSLRKKANKLDTITEKSLGTLENIKQAGLHLEHDTVDYVKHNPYKVMAGSLLAGTLITLYLLKDQLLHLK